MTDVKITVGGNVEDDAAHRFVDAWHRGQRGEQFRERHLAFESWDALARVLTGKRLELLRYVHDHRVTSVRALAKGLGRDYSNVHADVQMLGVYFASGDQHFDMRTLQDHAAPRSTSDLLYKGALRDRSHTVYSGLIRVQPGAEKTDANQSNPWFRHVCA